MKLHRVLLAAVLMLGVLAIAPEAKADPCVKIILNWYNCGNGCLKQVPQCDYIPHFKSCTFFGFLSCCGNGQLLVYQSTYFCASNPNSPACKTPRMLVSESRPKVKR